jgi:hypothetical protein
MGLLFLVYRCAFAFFARAACPSGQAGVKFFA